MGNCGGNRTEDKEPLVKQEITTQIQDLTRQVNYLEKMVKTSDQKNKLDIMTVRNQLASFEACQKEANKLQAQGLAQQEKNTERMFKELENQNRRLEMMCKAIFSQTSENNIFKLSLSQNTPRLHYRQDIHI